MRSQCQDREVGCTLWDAQFRTLNKLFQPWSLCSSAAHLDLSVGGAVWSTVFVWSVCGPLPLHFPVATTATPGVKIILHPGLSLGTVLGHLVPSWGWHWKAQHRQKPHSTFLVHQGQVFLPLQLRFNYMYHIRAQAGSTSRTLVEMLGEKRLEH